jgi:hypothetical protein
MSEGSPRTVPDRAVKALKLLENGRIGQRPEIPGTDRSFRGQFGWKAIRH